MVLTPADVHNVAFSRPRIGKRGYDEQEVDLFIDLVEQELIRHLEQEGQLRGRFAELRSRYGELQGREAELSEREAVLGQQDNELHKHEYEVRQQEARLAARMAQLDKRTAPLPQQLAQLRDREAQVAQGEAQLARQEADLAQREAELAQRAGEFTQQEADLAQRAGELARREVTLAQWENELSEQEAELHRRVDERQAVSARAGADAAGRQRSRTSRDAQQLRVVSNSAAVNGAPHVAEMHTVAPMHGRHDMERMAIRAVTDTLGNVVTETVHERTRRSPAGDGGPGVPAEQAGELERLREENAELNRSLRLLKSAAAFLAAALDRP